MARALNRTEPSVKNLAGILGMRREKEPPWMEEDVRFLRENWGRLTIHQLAKRLNRTAIAVLNKSKKLKLGPIHDQSCFDKREICKLLGVDHYKIDRWIEDGLLRARVAKTSREQGRCRGITEVRPRELLRFLRENQDLWDARRAGDIMKAVREKELLAEKVKVQREEGVQRRRVPWHLKLAFRKFVADVAMEAAERIRAARREPEWLRIKRERDMVKYLPREGFRWTGEEDEALRRMFRKGDMTYTEMGMVLGRSAEAVGHRLARIVIWNTRKGV